MRIKIPSSINHQNYIQSVLQLVTGVAISLMFFQANAAEVVAGTESSAGTANGSTKKTNSFLKGNTTSSDPSSLNNSRIIQETDFSKETGLSRQNQPLGQAGFSKKIILTTGVEHDSNPALDDDRKTSVWIYSLTPQLLLDYTGEVNSLYLDTALLIQRHSNEEILNNREDPRLRIGWDRTYASGLFGLYANYIESSTLREEIITTGVFAGNVDGESTQRDKTFGARWQHAIAPRWSLLTTGEHIKTAFSGVSGGADLVDSGLVDVRSRLNYEYTERLDTYIQLGYAKLKPDDTFEDTKLSRLAVGANYQLSEAFTVASRVGTYHATGRQSDTDWEAGIQLGYNAGRMRYIAELNRELSGSGVGGFQKADTLSLGWLFDISEIDTLRVNYSFVKFKEDEQILLAESETQEISAFYDRILRGNWRGQANFTFTEQSRTGSRSDGSVVGVSLIYDGLSF